MKSINIGKGPTICFSLCYHLFATMFKYYNICLNKIALYVILMINSLKETIKKEKTFGPRD